MKIAGLEHMELYKETKFSNNDMKTMQPYSFCAEENRSPLLHLDGLYETMDGLYEVEKL